MPPRSCYFIGGPMDGQTRFVEDREYVQTAPDDSEHGLAYYDRWRSHGALGLFVLKGTEASVVHERVAALPER